MYSREGEQLTGQCIAAIWQVPHPPRSFYFDLVQIQLLLACELLLRTSMGTILTSCYENARRPLVSYLLHGVF